MGLPPNHDQHLYLVVPSTDYGANPVVWNKVRFCDSKVTQKVDIPQNTLRAPTAIIATSSELSEADDHTDEQTDTNSSKDSFELSVIKRVCILEA